MSTIILYQGEALEVLRSLETASVDAVVTDSPYSSGGVFRSDRTVDTRIKYVIDDAVPERPGFLGDNRDQRAFGYWSALWLSEALRVARDGAPIVTFTDWRQLPTTTDALQAGGWVWRGIVPWDKTEGARPDQGWFRNQCEYAVWGTKGGKPEREGGECLPGIIRLYGKPSEKVHIAGKPVGMLRQLLRVVPPGGTVLDPFMGGGSTGMACMEEGFRFIGAELDPYWFEVAAKRIQGAASLFGGDGTLDLVRPERGGLQPVLAL